MHGLFNFSSKLMAPPGKKLVDRTTPSKRGSWDLNVEVRWHVGPSLNQYCCVKYYVPRKKGVESGTVELFLYPTPFPKTNLKDYLKHAGSEIVAILTNIPSVSTPELQAGDPTRNELLELVTVLQRV